MIVSTRDWLQDTKMCGELRLQATVFSITVFVLLLSNQSSATSIQQTKQATEPPGELCADCVDFSSLYLYQLTNITQSYTLKGGCTQLCNILEKESRRAPAIIFCSKFCHDVGMGAFLSAIKQSDLNPVYFCVILKGCFATDNGDATISSLYVTPSAIPEGGDYVITMILETINGTGMGQIQVLIKAAVGSPIMKKKTYLMEPQSNHTLKWDGKADVDPDCESNCMMWLPGKYIGEIAVCYQECEGNDPHSRVYDSKSFSFTVVKRGQ